MAAPVTGVGRTSAVVAGRGFACALESTGTVECWGDNTLDQLGNANGGYADAPTSVPGINDAVSVAANDDAACAVHASGSVSCWGAVHGTYGRVPNTPEIIPSISNAKEVTAGIGQMCALRADRTAACWQTSSSWVENANYSFFPDAALPKPLDLSSVTSAVAVSGSADTACALLNTGVVNCWGEDNSGELGNGTLDFSPTAQTVAGLP
jgi:alpha-tubulin suppressor-like RCC1 family protein